MKKVWILQTGDFNRFTQKFEFYQKPEAFTSKEKLDRAIANRIDCNKGYDVVTDSEEQNYIMITYKCLSTDGVQMMVRYTAWRTQLN